VQHVLTTAAVIQVTDVTYKRNDYKQHNPAKLSDYTRAQLAPYFPDPEVVFADEVITAKTSRALVRAVVPCADGLLGVSFLARFSGSDLPGLYNVPGSVQNVLAVSVRWLQVAVRARGWSAGGRVQWRPW
jgi:hypothetical protein